MRIINAISGLPEVVEVATGFFVGFFCRYGQDAYFGLLVPEKFREDLKKLDGSLSMDGFQAFKGNQQILNAYPLNSGCRISDRWFAATEHFNLIGRGVISNRDYLLTSNGKEYKAEQVFIAF